MTDLEELHIDEKQSKEKKELNDNHEMFSTQKSYKSPKN
jgi:hypothetical protein